MSKRLFVTLSACDMTSKLTTLLDFVFAIVFLVHLMVCPFTKVEESFNLQAAHDVLYHKLDIKQFDHLEFPGVVPRTFIGPLLISFLSSPVVYLLYMFNVSKIFSQLAVRAALGSAVVFAFIRFKFAVLQEFGPSVGRLLIILSMTQFHFMFYLSRPLPNTFALILVLFAFQNWMMQNHALFIWISAFVIIVFRSELCILLGLMLLQKLVTRKLKFTKAIVHSALAGVCALSLTVLVDSIFWCRWVWPEGVVLWYNTVLNKSSNWGTLPFLWYFYSAIPRVLLLTVFFIPVGLWRERRAWTLVAPVFGFVLMYSVLPHKELRFIIYVFPILNTVAACGLNYIYQNYEKWRPIVAVTVVTAAVGGLLCNCVGTGLFLYVSHHNYPGGVAFHRLHQLLKDHSKSPVNVHVCVAAAETGVSRFGELNPNWRYSKKEDISVGSSEMLRFSHLLTEAPCNRTLYDATHTILEEIHGFTRLSLDCRMFPFVLRVMFEPKICILERKGWTRK